MTATIVSYSRTGNNETLAARLAAELGAEHIRITERRPRTNFTITLDLLLRRIPRVTLSAPLTPTEGLLVFVAPVWMGQVAFPLRACLRDLSGSLNRYAFVSLSAGGDGPDSNPHLGRELEKRTKHQPLAVINLHIADLIASESKSTPEELMNYRLNDEDLRRLTDTVLSRLQEVMP